MNGRFLAFMLAVWYPLCAMALYFLILSLELTQAKMYVLIYAFALAMFAPLIWKAFKGNPKADTKRFVTIDLEKLPSFDALNTAHWSADEQIQFAKAVEGIRSIDWIYKAAPSADSTARDRLARAFAFAGFSELRRRMRMATDEELMLDEPGRSARIPETN